MVSDFCVGGDLPTYMANHQIGVFDEHRLQQIAREIAKGLQYLHENGIVHRDIRLQNILMSDSSDSSAPVICDFSQSVRLKKGEKCTTKCGSKDYKAPEILINQPYSYPVDIWSFGVLLYTLVSERLPFYSLREEYTNANISLAHSLINNWELNFDGDEWLHISDSLKGLLYGMLEKNPVIRLSANAVLEHPWMKDE